MDRIIRVDLFNNICDIGYSPTSTGIEKAKRTRDSVLDYCPSPDWQYRNDYLHPEYHRLQWADSSRLRDDTNSVDSNSNSEVEGAKW